MESLGIASRGKKAAELQGNPRILFQEIRAARDKERATFASVRYLRKAI